MIFVTVGSQTPFDRLIRAVDEVAGRSPLAEEVVAQIGEGDYRPQHIRVVQLLAPAAFRDHCRAAKLIVSHAGMGTVLTAMELRRPLLVMSRRGDLAETRNDHQIATARWLAQIPGIRVAEDEHKLGETLLEMLRCTKLSAPVPRNPSANLIAAIRGHIWQGFELPSLKSGTY